MPSSSRIGQGFQPVASFNYQAKEYTRVKKGLIFTLCFGSCFVGVLALFGLVFFNMAIDTVVSDIVVSDTVPEGVIPPEVEEGASVGLAYTLSSDQTYYTVTGIGTCADTDLVISSTYKGKPVKAIGYQAFYDCYNLTSINIPDSVTTIGSDAFYNCYGLTSIIIPDLVTTIGSNAFAACRTPEVIRLPASLQEVDEAFYVEHGIIPKWETGSKTPLFQMIRPNVANREAFNSPWGTSVYSGAVDIFASCDVIYDSFYKEFLLGKKRIFVTDGVANINYVKNGEEVETVEVFDPNDEVFYRIPEQDDGVPPIQPVEMALRVGDHAAALQTQLNILSQAVGFGSNGFKWEEGNVSTATQIISQNSELFRTLKKHETLLRDTIIDMVKGLLYVEATFAGDAAIRLDADISVDFDDSIIEDTAETRRQAMLELQSGLISKAEYFRQVYKLTDQQALEYELKMLQEIIAEMQAIPVPEEPEPEV